MIEKTRHLGDGGDGSVGAGEGLAYSLYPRIEDIFAGRHHEQLLELTLKMACGQIGDTRQLADGDLFMVISGDELDHAAHLVEWSKCESRSTNIPGDSCNSDDISFDGVERNLGYNKPVDGTVGFGTEFSLIDDLFPGKHHILIVIDVFGSAVVWEKIKIGLSDYILLTGHSTLFHKELICHDETAFAVLHEKKDVGQMIEQLDEVRRPFKPAAKCLFEFSLIHKMGFYKTTTTMYKYSQDYYKNPAIIYKKENYLNIM